MKTIGLSSCEGHREVYTGSTTMGKSKASSWVISYIQQVQALWLWLPVQVGFSLRHPHLPAAGIVIFDCYFVFLHTVAGMYQRLAENCECSSWSRSIHSKPAAHQCWSSVYASRRVEEVLCRLHQFWASLCWNAQWCHKRIPQWYHWAINGR